MLQTAIAAMVIAASPGPATTHGAWSFVAPAPFASGVVTIHQDPLPQPLGFAQSLPDEAERPEIVHLRSAFGFSASAPLLEWLTADISSSRMEWSSRAGDPGRDTRFDTRSHVILLTTGAHHPLTESFSIHARAGVLRTRTWTFTDGTDVRRRSEANPWFGLGARYRATRLMSFSADYGKATNEVWTVRLHVDWRF